MKPLGRALPRPTGDPALDDIAQLSADLFRVSALANRVVVERDRYRDALREIVAGGFADTLSVDTARKALRGGR